MKIEPFERKTGQPLADDYNRTFEQVESFYEYNPWEDASWARRAEYVDQGRHLSVNRTELVHSLIRYNDKISNDPEAFQRLEQLRSPGTLAVVGGQQAGLFTGPLLVIYKAITIIQAARRASEQLQRPVVPVFWIAGEDHDADEVNHTYILSQQAEVTKIKISLPECPRTSISRLTVDQWEDALNQLDEGLMDTEFKLPLMEKLTEFAGQSLTLTDYFARIMAWLFGKHGLILMDSDDPGIRKLEGPMFSELLNHHERVNGTVKSGEVKLREHGYEPQVEASSQSAHLFVFEENGDRILLHWDGDRFTDKKGERQYSPEQLQQWASHSPDRLSNNVITRPLMQEYLLPVLSTVLGPGELAYWGMTRPVFQALGMQMPILLPRKEHTLVEGTVQKYIDKYELTLAEAFEHLEEKKEQWLKAQDQLQLEAKFEHAKQRFAELYQPVLEAVASINPGMEKLGKTNAAKIIEQIDFLQARSTEANRAQYDAALRQWERVRVTLLPLGKPQERVYNLFSYVNKYGRGWLDDLVGQPLQLKPLHSIVYL